ncbi:MAG: response regulator [Syntrophales bacterium]|jgi:CheY-like chemotaxis protein|nr:response regulator [Syntrophales bacterium]
MTITEKILIIDDNADDIEITKIALEEIGRQEKVVAVTGGEEALKHLRGEKNLPALILLDLKMPGMSGFDVLREIRTDARLKPVPVVVVTSSTLDSDKQNAHAGGANGFLYKEVDIDRFSAALKTSIAALLFP